MHEMDELSDFVYRFYDFGFNNQKQFKRKFEEYLRRRVKLLLSNATYFYIEQHYIENEWKNMISMHYINTSYSSNLKNDVIRIHFFNANEMKNENYLGYLTLRPISELSIALSHVYLNWKKIRLPHAQEQKVMTIHKTVHINSTELEIETYPFFAQDGIVTCCVDANIVMMSKYLESRIGSYGIKLPDVDGSYLRGNEPLPRVLNMHDIIEILKNMRYPIYIHHYSYEDYMINSQSTAEQKEIVENKKISLIHFLNSYIESGLPVMLITNKHVIQLIGYSTYKNKRVYIAYDDSGYFSKNLNVVVDYDLGRTAFCYLVDIETLFDNQNIVESFYLAVPEYGRVYIGFTKYEEQLKLYMACFTKIRESMTEDKKSNFPKLFSIWVDDEGKTIHEDVKVRSLIVDNSILKQHIEQFAICKDNTDKTKFLQSSLPHYIWYTEIKDINTDEGLWFVCADPTCYFKTDNLSRLFLGLPPMQIKKPLSLLLESD